MVKITLKELINLSYEAYERAYNKNFVNVNINTRVDVIMEMEHDLKRRNIKVLREVIEA